MKKQELKAMIEEIQEEVQAKVTGQVVAMMQTFLGDVGSLLRHLLKGKRAKDPFNERTMETARALQVLHQFDLGESEYDSEADFDSDLEQSVSSERGSRKERDKGTNTQNSNTCQCGKVVRQYQTGSECILYLVNYRRNTISCYFACLYFQFQMLVNRFFIKYINFQIQN